VSFTILTPSSTPSVVPLLPKNKEPITQINDLVFWLPEIF
jgi:hypothetical protein